MNSVSQRSNRGWIRPLEEVINDIPSRTNVRALAEDEGMPRPTFEEHLHTAESKVMPSVAPRWVRSLGFLCHSLDIDCLDPFAHSAFSAEQRLP